MNPSEPLRTNLLTIRKHYQLWFNNIINIAKMINQCINHHKPTHPPSSHTSTIVNHWWRTTLWRTAGLGPPSGVVGSAVRTAAALGQAVAAERRLCFGDFAEFQHVEDLHLGGGAAAPWRIRLRLGIQLRGKVLRLVNPKPTSLAIIDLNCV